MDELNALVQEKLEADTEFQSSLDGLEDDERDTLTEAKREELLSNEYKTLKEQAEGATKAKELAENYKIRAEKAEKTGKPTTKEPSQEQLSNTDIIYLAKAEIHEDDTEEVLETAKLKKISVREAHEYLKPILEVREEQRKTATATQVNAGQRGGNRATGTQILDAAKSGRLPEDDAGIKALVEAEMAQKQAKN